MQSSIFAPRTSASIFAPYKGTRLFAPRDLVGNSIFAQETRKPNKIFIEDHQKTNSVLGGERHWWYFDDGSESDDERSDVYEEELEVSDVDSEDQYMFSDEKVEDEEFTGFEPYVPDIAEINKFLRIEQDKPLDDFKSKAKKLIGRYDKNKRRSIYNYIMDEKERYDEAVADASLKDIGDDDIENFVKETEKLNEASFEKKLQEFSKLYKKDQRAHILDITHVKRDYYAEDEDTAHEDEDDKTDEVKDDDKPFDKKDVFEYYATIKDRPDATVLINQYITKSGKNKEEVRKQFISALRWHQFAKDEAKKREDEAAEAKRRVDAAAEAKRREDAAKEKKEPLKPDEEHNEDTDDGGDEFYDAEDAASPKKDIPEPEVIKMKSDKPKDEHKDEPKKSKKERKKAKQAKKKNADDEKDDEEKDDEEEIPEGKIDYESVSTDYRPILKSMMDELTSIEQANPIAKDRKVHNYIVFLPKEIADIPKFKAAAQAVSTMRES